jgi:hypothetical protein
MWICLYVKHLTHCINESLQGGGYGNALLLCHVCGRREGGGLGGSGKVLVLGVDLPVRQALHALHEQVW